jgi:hypothetical protein
MKVEMQFKKADMFQLLKQGSLSEPFEENEAPNARQLHNLAILQLIIGGGVCLGAILSLFLQNLSYAMWDQFGRTLLSVTALFGFPFVLINYLFKSKGLWTCQRLILVVLVGATSFACLLAHLCTIIEVRKSYLGFIFLSGTPFLLSGYSILTDRYWKKRLQRLICFLFAAGILFISCISWRSTPKMLILIFSLISLPPLYLAFALTDSEFKKPVRISIRIFFLTLILIWGFILVVGLLSLIHSEQRHRQRETTIHLWAISVAINAYAADHNTYPSTQSMEDLAKLLEPTYIKELPRKDGWHFPIEYYGILFEKNSFNGYVIRSPGNDGKFEHRDPTAYKDGPVAGFERDMVFSSGSMSQWPEGQMQP